MMQRHKRLSRRRIEPAPGCPYTRRDMGWGGELMSMSVRSSSTLATFSAGLFILVVFSPLSDLSLSTTRSWFWKVWVGDKNRLCKKRKTLGYSLEWLAMYEQHSFSTPYSGGLDSNRPAVSYDYYGRLLSGKKGGDVDLDTRYSYTIVDLPRRYMSLYQLPTTTTGRKEQAG